MARSANASMAMRALEPEKKDAQVSVCQTSSILWKIRRTNEGLENIASC